MSRVGRLPVKVPDGVTVAVRPSAIDIKGPKGTSTVSVPKTIEVEQKGKELVVKRADDSREARSLHGLTRKHIANGVTGVSTGFSRVLEINGVGYRAEVRGGSALYLTLGFSHP